MPVVVVVGIVAVAAKDFVRTFVVVASLKLWDPTPSSLFFHHVLVSIFFNSMVSLTTSTMLVLFFLLPGGLLSCASGSSKLAFLFLVSDNFSDFWRQNEFTWHPKPAKYSAISLQADPLSLVPALNWYGSVVITALSTHRHVALKLKNTVCNKLNHNLTSGFNAWT